jgi:hypothetical protein
MVEQNSQILTKAIQKAKNGGWEFETIVPWRDGYGVKKLRSLQHLKEFDVEHIIYNHDFAKALWGEPKPMTTEEARASGYIGGGGQLCTPRNAGWKYHLQKMVIANDPIKYLGDYLDGRKEA